MNDLKSQLLLVEDDQNLGFVTSDNLKEKGFDVTWVKDGEAGYEAFLSNKYDVLILDVMLPKLDGFSLAKKIRSQDNDVPIFFLTAKSLQDDKIEGLQIGADDYITKPFNLKELTLRIQNIINRMNRENDLGTRDVFEIGKFSFDYLNHELRFEDSVVTLTRKEADLLRLLCLHRGEVLERNAALRMVWGKDDYFLGRSMDVFITKLRKYLKLDPAVQIVNIHGVGFRLETDSKEQE